MTLEQLVPTLEVCQQLRDKGFPQDTAMVYAHIKDANSRIVRVVMSRDDASAGCIGADCDGQMVVCSAPTAGELEEWLMEKGHKFRCAKNLFGAYAIVASRLDEDEDNKEHHPYDGYGKEHVAALAALVLEVAG